MKLYFISTSRTDLEDYDLFVWARYREEAVKLWMAHYEFEDEDVDDNLDKLTVFEIPLYVPQKPTSFGWHKQIKEVEP